MGTRLLIAVLLAIVAVHGDVVPTEENKHANFRFLEGNPQLCNSRALFPVLPGNGWDNLQNQEMDLVIQHNYSLCAMTDDGQYLIPDEVITIPIKSSRVQTSAELIDHWDNYTSTTSSSINADANLGFSGFKIGGKFSKDYSSVKEKQYNEKAVTTRTQARYLVYQTILDRGVSLNPNFKSRVQKISFYVTLNKLDLARYESQLLVRDYGTHVVTRMDVGAVIVKVDQVKKSYVGQSSVTKQSITASASASFFGHFDFGAGYSKQTSQSSLDTYLKQVTTSEIQSFGGTMFKPTNYSVNQWIDSMEDGMVAIDVDGDPLTYFINQQTLPDIPVQIIADVRTHVAEAIATYYKHNTYKGCTDPESPNFSFQANMDDGACKPPNTNFTFGGVYQTCSSSGYTNLCANMDQKNPLTGDFTCPKGYSSVLLNSGTKSSSTTQRECSSCYLFFRCCDTRTLSAHASYYAYWCAADGPVGMDQGFLFGGTFTSKVTNPLTQSNSCPQYFYGLRVLQDLTICASDDYEIAGPLSLPFAGFFTCRTGNPLAISEELNLLKHSPSHMSLISFIKSSGQASYSKKCPKGYSQHLVVVDSGCEINYCVKAGAFSAKGLLAVQRPPFMTFPEYEAGDLDPEKFKIIGLGDEWITIDKSPTAMQSMKQRMLADLAKSNSKSDSEASEGGMSATGAGILGAIVSLVVIVCACLIVLLVRRKKTAVFAESCQQYGSIGDATV